MVPRCDKPAANQENPMTITRFAPSPTGYIHVGNLRTALMNYLIARAVNWGRASGSRWDSGGPTRTRPWSNADRGRTGTVCIH